MAISTQAQLSAAIAGAQEIDLAKTQRISSTSTWASLFNNAINAGTLAGTSTAAGVVPTDATTGCPTIFPFGAGNTGYIASVEFSAARTDVDSATNFRLLVADMLFKAGAYNFSNANVTLAGQPSYSSRIPGGDYKGVTIWIECVTASTGNPVITVTYTNQDGVAGRTGTIALGGVLNAGRIFVLPLQAGDTGVQKIESVVSTTATAGTFNVLILRMLWMGATPRSGGASIRHGPDLVQMPIVYDDSALYVASVNGGNSNVGAASVSLKIING
jgi:hypothetical protein